ncbi:MerR family transcriptional regulator [Saccharothrix variisporea]|uniref:B12 binding protein n=1 Tax=Saccharothrix variisporea TaxID=543527 RepID=A0A495X5D0_9PSEU|nr:MerR family transcriptional regulator [Saccharothrix variisporea]RKT68746.1 B12 binding protein [Saccharothrix variisporea]
MLWSAGAVARMLGVSPTTLRTWDRRYGLGPSRREEGRHRRYSEEDVARLRRMLALTGRGVVPAAAAAIALGRTLEVEPDLPPPREQEVPADSPPREVPADSRPPEVPGDAAVGLDGVAGRPWSPETRGFARAAFRLDLPLMIDLAGGLVARHGVVRAWERVLVPFLVALGEKVAARGSGVEVEHLATTAILEAVRGGVLPVSGRLPALLACAPDEQHSLPLNVLGAALAEKGCPTRHLGARVPAAALLDAVKLLEPRVVVLWAHAPGYAALAPVTDLLERGSDVLLGGAGWTVVPPGARWVGSLGEAVDAVLELNRF